MDERLFEPLQQLIGSAPGIWQVLLILAVFPAVCEEIAFRGFILSGLRHAGTKWHAIVVSSLFFGIAHGVLQQSIIASIFGLVLGFVAVHTGSLLPCIAFHATHNALGILASDWLPKLQAAFPDSPLVVRALHEPATSASPLLAYGAFIVVPSAVAAVWLLKWLHQLPFQMTDEERLQVAIKQSAAAIASP